MRQQTVIRAALTTVVAVVVLVGGERISRCQSLSRQYEAAIMAPLPVGDDLAGQARHRALTNGRRQAWESSCVPPFGLFGGDT